jgi:outer membrane protein insertion porin family
MQKLYFFIVIAMALCLGGQAIAQGSDTSRPVTGVSADLMNIFDQKVPKKYKIGSVKVTGSSYDQNVIIAIGGLNAGDEITIPGGDNFAKAINKLYAQNYFSDIQLYITGLKGNVIDIEYVVTSRPKLNKAYYTGVSKGDAEELAGKTGIIPGRIVTEAMKQNAIDVIKKFYADKSLSNTTVTVREVKATNMENAIDLFFDISKGIKSKVEFIGFADNTIPARTLKSKMSGTHEMTKFTLFPQQNKDTAGFARPETYTFKQYVKDMGFLTYSKTRRVLEPYVRLKLFTSGKFNRSKYEEDKEKLVDFYNSIGFRDAFIEKDVVLTDSATGHKSIHIRVNEGHKYHFGNITWSGNTKYSDSILTVILGIKKGDVYNLELLNKRLGKQLTAEGGDIGGLYMDDGYLFFRSDPVETAVYNDTIDYEIRIVEGPQAIWKNVRITGNEKTKEHVIRRELRTIPGEKFSRADLIRTQRELGQLNFFNPEKINPNVVPNPEDGTVDVTWQLEEKSSDQLELSAGFGGGIGLTGTLGITFNNFSIGSLFKKGAWDPLPQGDGQRLSMRVQSNGRAYRAYNFSFTEPWLGGKKRNAFTVGFYDTKFSNAYDPYTGTYTSQRADSSYFRTTGVSLGLAKQLKWPDDYFQLGFTLNYARYRLKNYVIDNINLPGFNNGHSNNLSLKISLQRNSAGPNPYFPSSGSNFLASLQVTPPYSLIDKSIETSVNPYKFIEYHKWRFTGEWYVPFGRPAGSDKNQQFILKIAAKYGFIGRYNSNLKISPFERFQVGNSGLSNSYALLGYDIIAQRGYPVYENSDPRVNPDQQGASQYFTMFNKYVLELRYPLSLNPSSTIYALSFFEAANGWYQFKDYNPFKLRRSVGVGMRFFLPMFGLLGFDYGIGLDRTTPGNGLKGASSFTFMLGFEPE